MTIARIFSRHACAALFAVSFFAALPAQAADKDAEAAIHIWLEAIKSGDQARLASVLAPEFQIQRSSGEGHDKGSYATGGAAKISSIQEISNLHATRSNDVMVVRYDLSVTETIEGKGVQRKAPRLTVFRKVGNAWLVVAHANFAQIER